MHCLETLKRLNAGKIKINRSVEFSPAEVSRAPGRTVRKAERLGPIEGPIGYCHGCDTFHPADQIDDEGKCLLCHWPKDSNREEAV